MAESQLKVHTGSAPRGCACTSRPTKLFSQRIPVLSCTLTWGRDSQPGLLQHRIIPPSHPQLQLKPTEGTGNFSLPAPGRFWMLRSICSGCHASLLASEAVFRHPEISLHLPWFAAAPFSSENNTPENTQSHKAIFVGFFFFFPSFSSASFKPFGLAWVLRCSLQSAGIVLTMPQSQRGTPPPKIISHVSVSSSS